MLPDLFVRIVYRIIESSRIEYRGPVISNIEDPEIDRQADRPESTFRRSARHSAGAPKPMHRNSDEVVRADLE